MIICLAYVKGWGYLPVNLGKACAADIPLIVETTLTILCASPIGAYEVGGHLPHLLAENALKEVEADLQLLGVDPIFSSCIPGSFLEQSLIQDWKKLYAVQTPIGPYAVVASSPVLSRRHTLL
jgi:hypothetical protein